MSTAIHSIKQLLLASLLILAACNSPKQIIKDTSAIIPADLVIKNVTIIDAKNKERTGKTVFIKDNRIVAVSSFNAATIPSSATIVDGKDQFLIPGLWDAHVHLSFEQDLTPAMFDLFLAYGITSVRDTGGELRLVLPQKAAANKDPKNTPRVMVAGPLLDGVPTVYDGSSANRPKLGVGAGSVEAAEALVEEFVGAGVDLLKAYEMLTPEAFNAVIAKAKMAGLPITGHVPLSMDVVAATQAGMSSMEHMRNLEMACSSDWEALLKVRQKMLADGANEEGGTLRSNIHSAQRTHAVDHQDATRRQYVLEQLALNNTRQVPTMTIVTSSALRPFAKDTWKDGFKYLPNKVEERWRKNLEGYLATPVKPSQAAYSDWALEMIGHLKTANVGIMAGTDCPIFFLTPGYSLHEELALLVKGGLTPLEAIEAATVKPAEYFNMQNELGLIEKGMLADLVLLSKNPLTDIRNTTSIVSVIRDGKLHDRAALDQIFLRLEKQ